MVTERTILTPDSVVERQRGIAQSGDDILNAYYVARRSRLTLPHPTPLEPRTFFTGRWTGQGSLRAHRLLRWLLPNDSVHLVSQVEWQSEDSWTVQDRIEYGSGTVVERRMEARLTAPDRVTITAPDMPDGAEIRLKRDRFVFSPYLIVAEYRGRRVRLRSQQEPQEQPRMTVIDECSRATSS
jgi:hypothetical protein